MKLTGGDIFGVNLLSPRRPIFYSWKGTGAMTVYLALEKWQPWQTQVFLLAFDAGSTQHQECSAWKEFPFAKLFVCAVP